MDSESFIVKFHAAKGKLNCPFDLGNQRVKTGKSFSQHDKKTTSAVNFNFAFVSHCGYLHMSMRPKEET